MRPPAVFQWMFALAVIGAATTSWAATNETVEVTARQKDNPQQNSWHIEGWFQDNPTGDKDEIHVINDNVKGTGADVYNDPVNDGALLRIAQQSGPVKVDVEGREGIGAMYWVTVMRTAASGPGPATPLWADVADVMEPGALVLKDKNHGWGESDRTDSDTDTPTLYAGTAADGKGDVEFWLWTVSGTYDWVLKQGGAAIRSGTLTGPSYKSEEADLAPGLFVLEVTQYEDPDFKRTINLAIVRVTFDPDPVRTGFTIPVAQSTITRPATATVVPAELTNDIEISLDGPTAAEVAIQNLARDAAAGRITFDVKGLAATPAAFPGGRTTIQAKCQGHLVGGGRAIVHVPTDIHTPHPAIDADATPVNFLADNGTSPTWANKLLGTQCALITHWSHLMTIRVDDQWGNALNDLYTGAHIEELFGPHWWYIHLDLSANGTYQDPVGWMQWPNDPIVLRTSQRALDWPLPAPPPTLTMVPPLPGEPVHEQRIEVKVGGHRVGQVRRDVIHTPPNRITIRDAN